MPKITKEIPYGEHTLVLETGEIARQADGAVFASMAGTQVLVTVVGKKEAALDKDFFPLVINFQKKASAGGKIPGGFNKREGRPSESETLTSRLMDRPLRPLFPDNFFNEVQIIATVFSLNPQVSADIVAMIGASAALAISGIPHDGPIAAARVGYKDGIYLLNPGINALTTSELDLVVAGTKDAILMVESEAKELNEEIMLGAILFGHEMMQAVIRGIKDLAAEVNKKSWELQPVVIDPVLAERLELLAGQMLSDAYLIKDKQMRHQKIIEIKEQVIKNLTEEQADVDSTFILNLFDKLEKKIVRQRILAGEPRIDGRDHKTVRPITIRTGFLERTHGSALFTRGETQAIVAVTLGNERDAQILDELVGESKERFMLHYNFPPYSVGEIGMIGSPKRREIGHGALAKRGMKAVLPSNEQFPYVLRVVSDITESNGSSSMATVCGTSLSLMDAGVPLKAPVAGIAMGLISENEQSVVLTDILGDEDHLGDMDFKVVGTKHGITALQMDIKVRGITKEVIAQALDQALAGRLHILDVMENYLPGHRIELSPYAPRIVTMKVPESKVRTIIGKGGATIKNLIETTGVTIDIDDSGAVQLFATDEDALVSAQKQIKDLIAEIEVGQVYIGKISKIVEFGAFINLLPGKDGLLHISQICTDRSQKVTDILHEGHEVQVLVAGVDKQGKIKLEWQNKPKQQSDSLNAEVRAQETETKDSGTKNLQNKAAESKTVVNEVKVESENLAAEGEVNATVSTFVEDIDLAVKKETREDL